MPTQAPLSKIPPDAGLVEPASRPPLLPRLPPSRGPPSEEVPTSLSRSWLSLLIKKCKIQSGLFEREGEHQIDARTAEVLERLLGCTGALEQVCLKPQPPCELVLENHVR